MKKAVKEVVKTVKAVKVEVQENQIDRRMFNPGRPKSKEAQQQEDFVFELTEGQTFTVDGLSGEFSFSFVWERCRNSWGAGLLWKEFR